MLDLGAGTGRVALDLAAAGHDVTALDSDAELLDELARRAPRARPRGRCRRRRRPQRSALGARFALVLAPMQFVQLLGGAAGPRRPARRRRAPPRARAARFAAALADLVRGRRRPRTPRRRCPDVRESDGWVYSSLPLDVRAGARRRRGRPAAPDRVARGRARPRSCHTQLLDSLTPERARGRGRAATACAPSSAARGARDRRDYVGSTVVCWRPVTLRGLLALPRADEHLRRPRQHRRAARALRVARASASSSPRPALGEPLDPDAPRPLLHGRRPGPRPGRRRRTTWSRPSATRSTPRPTRGAVVLAVCGGYQLLGHSYELGDEELPGRRPRRPAHRARAGPAADRQLRDRGRPRRRARA